jgi:hypothetical protein
VVGGLGGCGNVGGISLVSFIVRSPVNYSILSSTTAVSFSRFILTYTALSFLQNIINSSPLSSTFVSVFTMLLYTSVLFAFPMGDKCTHALIGDLYDFIAPNSVRLSAVSGASITSRFSSGTDILLNFLRSITLLKYPSAKLTIVCQLSY